MRNIINEMYDDLTGTNEVCAKTYQMTFQNFIDISDYGTYIWRKYKNERLVERKANEHHFHNFLKHQLFSRLQEIKYYSKVDLNDTRRLVAVSADCISTIQILVRDKIYLNVYFRSSDIDGALPADLEFLSTLPSDLIVHMQKLQDAKGYEDATEELMRDLRTKQICLTLMFGSLHRTI